ncbi:NAD(P)-dependent alcohol dehydrogenase [Vulcanisaeta distributa]|uniref:NAD(P)-dependent alcohol dehydrogenase n=1 Tax=Vulcanisaeta distributa TaxID=164451 RepID=UPI0006D149AB|nr:NAD(P)-dependent alcohol dehydrogenase [Vulcanisaeta distributa]
MKVKAAILQEFGKPLKIGYVDIPEPGDDESVLIKIIGAGMCKTDIRLWKGEEPREGFGTPFVLGHENAGIIEAVGKRVKGLNPGDKVLVYAIWADLNCKYCRIDKCMMCKGHAIPGQSYYYGGYAEYLYVPNYRYLVKIDIDPPIEAAPLADAGLTSYSAVKKALPYLKPDSVVIVYGVGGLASYAIQFLKHLVPYVKIVAVSRSDSKLKWAMELGAHYAVHPSDVNKVIKDLNPDGAAVMLDFVGNEDSAKMIPLLEPGGAVILVGMEGKSYPIPVFETTVWQYVVIGSNYGSISEMEEMVKFVKEHGIKSYIEKVPLEEDAVNNALNRLAEGKILGRFVITP